MKFLVSLILAGLFQSMAFAADIGNTVKAEENVGLNYAAHVEQVVWVEGQSQTVKLFTVVGGDSAINPINLYVAVFAGVADGYKVYSLGMMENFELVQNTKDGYLKIKVLRTTLDEEGEEINQKSVLFVNITDATNGQIWTQEVVTK